MYGAAWKVEIFNDRNFIRIAAIDTSNINKAEWQKWLKT
jgi:hypothetical protein